MFKKIRTLLSITYAVQFFSWYMVYRAIEELKAIFDKIGGMIEGDE